MRRRAWPRRMALLGVAAVLAAGCSSGGGGEAAGAADVTQVDSGAETSPSTGQSSTTQPDPAPVGNPYEGEVLEILIPFSEGDGADAWGQAIGPFFERYLAEDVAVVVYNDGGETAAASLYENSVDHDGLTLLVSSDSISIPFLLDGEAVEYDYADLVGVIGSPVGGVVYASPETGIASPADLCDYGEELTMGARSLFEVDAVPALALNLLGLEPEIVDGLEGSEQIRDRFEGGEFNLGYDMSEAKETTDELFAEGLAVPLFTLGIMQTNGTLGADATWPDLPTIADAYGICNGSAPQGAAWDAYRAVNTAGFSAKANMWVHADAPPEHIGALQTAAAKMVADEEFQVLAADLVGAYDLVTGADVDAQFEAVSQLSAEPKAYLCDFLLTAPEISGICGA